MMSASPPAAVTRADDEEYSDIASCNQTIKEGEDEEEVDDLSNSPNDVSEDRNAVSEEMASEQHNSPLKSGSFSLEKSKGRLPSDSLAVEEGSGNFGSSNGIFTRQEVSHKNHEESKYLNSGKHVNPSEGNGNQECEISKKEVGVCLPVKIHNEENSDGRVHLCNGQITESEATSPSSFTRKIVAGGFQIGGCLAEGTSDGESMPMDLDSGDDEQKIESRFASHAVRTRSMSPGAENKDGTKRPAVICDFFSKGRCTKANSCRFLHVKDNMNDTAQLLEEDVGAASLKTDAQFGEGSRDMIAGSQVPSFPDTLACSDGKFDLFSSDLSSERILAQEPGESKRLPRFQENHRLSLLQKENMSPDNSPAFQQLASSREDIGFILSSKDAGRESLRPNWRADYENCTSLINKGSSPIFRNNLHSEYRSSSIGSALLSSNYHSGNPSSYPSSLEERPWIQNKYMHNDYSSQILSHTMNSSTSGPTSRSHHISTWTGSSFPFYSSSFSASPVDAKKVLDKSKECRNSRLSLFLRSTSPFSVSEPENPRIVSDCITKISSNDWEPSVPFRPSFFISPTGTASPGSQYDPLRDSLDSPKIGHTTLKFSFSGVEDSALNTSDHKLCDNSMLSDTVVPACNVDKSSVSSHGRFHENVLDKSCSKERTDSLSDREEGVGTSIVDEHNGAMPKENDHLVSTSVKDINKSKKINGICESRIQDDGCRQNKELKVERARQNSEIDLEHKSDGDGRRESRLMKHFRAALIDFVKELLKPTWREGRLSKDAHNTIVKKAVDKVVSTLQPHQIPTTMESIKQYLSLSQPKIAKLVEGYVDKYGRS